MDFYFCSADGGRGKASELVGGKACPRCGGEVKLTTREESALLADGFAAKATAVEQAPDNDLVEQAKPSA